MEFSDPYTDSDRFRRRLNAAGIFVLICMILLFSRFIWLQVIKYDHYNTRATENHISLLPIQPNRGMIVDRHGFVLARNYSAYTLEITPKQTPDIADTIERLSRLIEITPKDRARFKRMSAELRNNDSVPIRYLLTDEEVAKALANRYRFPGVEIRARLFRQYPEGKLASHMLGYIGRINAKDKDIIDEEDQTQNYLGALHYGKSGLEAQYEFVMHGITGFDQMEVDAAGRGIRSLASTPPTSGDDLILSIDAQMQKIGEEAFAGRNGALIAIEPATGSVLSFISLPGYDPNLFVDGIDPDNWKELNESPSRPMVNRAINGTYPPGSTFKLFMALAGLESGKRTPEQTISDPGYYTYGGHTFRDDKKGGHGLVNLFTSIALSCDTYYYMLANELGIDAIASFISKFGFGKPTGIDLPGESKGILPSPEWKKKRFKTPALQKWYGGETISIGIGQGYNSYTPMQLAQAVATLANRGVTMKPHLVEATKRGADGVRVPVKPEQVGIVALKPANLNAVIAAMVGVNQIGTGSRAFAGAQYTSAGKTGTAQVFSLKGGKYSANTQKHLRDHAWFVVFAPVEAPKIAVVVLVENGGFGAEAAAPIARQVLDYYLLGKVPAKAPPPETSATVSDETLEEPPVDEVNIAPALPPEPAAAPATVNP